MVGSGSRPGRSPDGGSRGPGRLGRSRDNPLPGASRAAGGHRRRGRGRSLELGSRPGRSLGRGGTHRPVLVGPPGRGPDLRRRPVDGWHPGSRRGDRLRLDSLRPVRSPSGNRRRGRSRLGSPRQDRSLGNRLRARSPVRTRRPGSPRLDSPRPDRSRLGNRRPGGSLVGSRRLGRSRSGNRRRGRSRLGSPRQDRSRVGTRRPGLSREGNRQAGGSRVGNHPLGRSLSGSLRMGCRLLGRLLWGTRGLARGLGPLHSPHLRPRLSRGCSGRRAFLSRTWHLGSPVSGPRPRWRRTSRCRPASSTKRRSRTASTRRPSTRTRLRRRGATARSTPGRVRSPARDGVRRRGLLGAGGWGLGWSRCLWCRSRIRLPRF